MCIRDSPAGATNPCAPRRLVVCEQQLDQERQDRVNMVQQFKQLLFDSQVKVQENLDTKLHNGMSALEVTPRII
eukprot:4228440-Pyramimonas_sp.AAC.2